MIPWFAGVALAAPPEGVRPVVARPAAAGEYKAWLAANGRPAADLACDSGWPGLAALCWRVWEPAPGEPPRRARRWATTADLARWSVDLAALRETARGDATRSIGLATSKRVEGMTGSYVELIDGDGGSAAALLAPDVLASKLGGPPIVAALPSDVVLLAWKPGDEAFDLAMAVGVHEVYTRAETPITEVVHLWDGAAWSAWGVPLPTTP
jgi:hypothetical protein